jgi:flagellar biogenesis protein FliO
MYEFLLILHSWLRWIVLIFGIYAIWQNYQGWQSQRKYTAADKRLNTFFIGSLHLQLVIGLILYFGVSPMMQGIMADFGGSMKVKELRFWSVEHLTGMIVGIAVAQIGSIKSKKQSSDTAKFRTAFNWFLIGLLIILLMIPFGIWNVERPFFRM